MRAAATWLVAAALVVPGAARANSVAEPAVSATPTDESASSAPIVRRIVVRSEAAIDEDELAPLVALEVGAPLDGERVRSTLRNLRLAGVASEVELFTRPVADGVEAELVLRPDLVVASLGFEGDSGMSFPKLLAVVPQKRGQPLREDRVLRGVYKIQELLQGEGWREPKVRLEVAPQPGGRTVAVIYHVVAGTRSRIGEVEVSGIGALANELGKTLRARPGEPYRPAAIREDRERLERWLASRDYRRASVATAEESPRPGGTVVDLRWEVVLGPRFELELVGAERKALEKRGLLTFLGDATFDESAVLESIDAIKDDFQRRGHYRVEVEDELTESAEVQKLRLEIVPGPKLKLVDLRFEGNESFSSERLTRLLYTSPRKLLQLERGWLVDSEIAEDLVNLRSFYALEGFDQVRLGAARIEAVGPDEIAVVFPIQEGRRLTTGEVRVEGAVHVEAEELAKDLPLRAGGPFHRLLQDAAADTIRARLEERGYRRAIVEPEIVWNESQLVANVRFEVLEGPQATVEAVIVRGNVRTETSVVRRFVDLDPGDPISAGRLLDVQRGLYGLGIFSRVDVRAPRAAATSERSEVLIEVEEGRSRSIAYGAGYDSESGVRGLFRFSHANLAGRALAFQADALVSQKDELYRALLRQPYLFHWPIEASATIYDQHEVRPDFEVDRRGAQLGAERQLGRTRLGLFAEYRLVDLESDAAESTIPRESRNARVASLTPTAMWDRRDDPIDPTRGWSATLQLERAFPIADAEADYWKLFSQLAGYRRLGRGVLAASLRGGALRPEAESDDPSVPSIDLVPAAELFYAGGRTTHRAFARDELGVLGQSIVREADGELISRGGGALALLNVEWRLPIAGAFGIALFVDGGNVWREIDDVDLSQTRWGAGVGLRYASPVGPLRLEIGWKLDREPFEDPYEAFLSLGNAF